MSEPFVGEIRMFPYTFPPQGWARCDGQSIPIAQNQLLAAVIGTIYGGNATTIQLPNLQGRAPMGAGNGLGLSPRPLSQTGGSELVTLTVSQLPSHQHQSQANGAAGVTDVPANNLLYGGESDPAFMLYKESPSASSKVPMAAQVLQSSGGGNGHENRQPYLPIQFCIALEGLYPQRAN